MTRLRDWASRDPGLALVVLALLVAAGLYAPALGYGLVSYDDPILYQSNHILQSASLDSLATIFTDLDPQSPFRFLLGHEYLPVRDLSVMLDFAIWGPDRYGGFHATNLVLYLLSIAMVFRMLDAFGFDRTIAGIATLIWALHPAHAESVAWLSERKGLLAILCAATAGFAYARFRAGGRALWLAAAMLAAVAAVWSKAPAAFVLASLAGLELVQPARRVSWKRSLVGLAAIAVVAALAFVPVVIVATQSGVVGESAVPGDRLAGVLGVHGFYVQLSTMLIPNGAGYPISKVGPSAFEIVLGAIGLLALAAAFVPRLRATPELRAAAVIWLLAWFPVSHLVLPHRTVAVADRYALVLVLGFALAVAAGVRRLQPRLQIALVAAIALAASIRTLDARTSWSSDLALWERAVRSNPHEGRYWSSYAFELEKAGLRDEADRAVETGLSYGESAGLRLRRGLFHLERGNRDAAISDLKRSADRGSAIAMGHLAQLLVDTDRDDALAWGRRAAQTAPTSMFARRAHGIAALAAGHRDEAVQAFDASLQLDRSAANHFQIATAMVQLGARDLAIPHFEACLSDPELGARARAALAKLRGMP